MGSSEEEIYSTMFSSLKHPVRRKILRMLANKPMTFMEMVELLGVSSSHLTYHLECLGELIFKMDNNNYKLSSFGIATVNAMKGVEDPETEPKRHPKLSFKWRAVFAALLVVIILLTVFSTFQYASLNQFMQKQSSLMAENQQLLSWGIGTDKVANLLDNVAKIDTTQYKIALLSNTLEFRQDFGVAEEILKYSLTSSQSNIDVDLRFRANHLSRYQLTQIESTGIYQQTQPSDILQIAKGTLDRYHSYSGDSYLEEMSNLLSAVNKTDNLSIIQGNLKLQITSSADETEFLWMYSERGIDFSAKSLRMTFQNRLLTGLTDGYFLFTVGNTDLAISEDQAVDRAKNYVKTLTWTIDGKQVTGFNTEDQPVSVQLLPHPRGNSVALIPYWYIVLSLDRTYSGGINEVSVGLFADTGQVEDVQMLSG